MSCENPMVVRWDAQPLQLGYKINLLGRYRVMSLCWNRLDRHGLMHHLGCMKMALIWDDLLQLNRTPTVTVFIVTF